MPVKIVAWNKGNPWSDECLTLIQTTEIQTRLRPRLLHLFLPVISIIFTPLIIHSSWRMYLFTTPHLSTLSLFHFVLCGFLGIVVVWTWFPIIKTLNREFILSEIQTLNSYRAVNTIRNQHKNNQLMLRRQTISYVVSKLQSFQTLNPLVGKVTTGLQNVNHADCNYTDTSVPGCVFFGQLNYSSCTMRVLQMLQKMSSPETPLHYSSRQVLARRFSKHELI